MMRTITRRHKGMTALQAAILTGISIAVALIVGYWIWTVVVGSIRTERLTMTIPTANYTSGNGGYFNVTLTLKNVGPSDTTILDVRVNGKPYSEWADGTNSYTEFNDVLFDASTGKSLAAGDEVKVEVILDDAKYKHGQTIEIAFVTAANQVYTSSVALP